MPNDFTDWFFSDSWRDYKQTKQIRDLEAGLVAQSSARASAARRQRALARQQGSLEGRVDQLARAFDAFVELADMRERLAMFDGPQLARFRTRTALVYLADGRFGGNLAEFEDVPGYWLPPAVKGFITLLESGAARSRTLIAEGRRRDDLRTCAFGVLLLSLAGQGERAQPECIEAAFVPLRYDVPAGRVQRAVWIDAADGALGEDGHRIVTDRLSDLVGDLEPDARADEGRAWTQLLDRKFGRPLAPAGGPENAGSDSTRGMAVATVTATVLDGVGSWLERIASTPLPTGPGPRRVYIPDDSIANDATPGDPNHGGSPRAGAGDADSEEAEREERADSRAVVLQQIVDEGSAEEVPWLARVRTLRAIVGGESLPYGAEDEAGGHGPPLWQQPVGLPLDLMRADALDDEHPGRVRVAIAAAAPVIGAAVDAVATRIGARPTQVPLSLDGASLSLDVTKPVEGQLGGYDAAVDHRHPIDTDPAREARLWVIIGGVVAAAGLGLLAVSLPLGIAIAALGLIGLVIGGIGRRRANAARAQVQHDRAAARQAGRDRADAAVTAYHDAQVAWDEARERAQERQAAIHPLLGRIAAPPTPH